MLMSNHMVERDLHLTHRIVFQSCSLFIIFTEQDVLL